MLRRTIVVLAVLAMLVGLLPAVAVAGAADITHVEVQVEYANGDPVSNTNVDVWLNDLSVWGGSSSLIDDTGTTDPVETVKDDFDDSGATADDYPQKDDAVVIVVDDPDESETAWYYFYATLSDADGDGEAQLSVVLPTPGSGQIEYAVDSDTDIGSGTSLSDYQIGSDEPLVSVYKDGVLWYSIEEDDDTINVGPGTFTVKADVSDVADAVPAHPSGLIDNSATGVGAEMWFSQAGTAAGATLVNVPANTTIEDVDFVYRNDEASLDGATYDHVDMGVFADMMGNFAEGAAGVLYAHGFVEGCDSTPNFCPDDDITRAEFAAILGRISTGDAYPVVVTPPFPDVPTDYWAAGWIQDLADDDIVEGDADGNFNPEAPITRAEAAVMIVRLIDEVGFCYDVDADDLPAPTLSFIDVPITHWAAAEIAWLYDQGIVLGNTDGTYGPETPITRAEMAAILARINAHDC